MMAADDLDSGGRGGLWRRMTMADADDDGGGVSKRLWQQMTHTVADRAVAANDNGGQYKMAADDSSSRHEIAIKPHTNFTYYSQTF